MAAILAGNNVEEEYLWSCTLTGSSKEYTWEPTTLEPESKDEEKEGPKVKPGHRLLIKTAILMPSAKKDEVTVVQIESEGYNKQTVSQTTLSQCSKTIENKGDGIIGLVSPHWSIFSGTTNSWRVKVKLI